MLECPARGYYIIPSPRRDERLSRLSAILMRIKSTCPEIAARYAECGAYAHDMNLGMRPRGAISCAVYYARKHITTKSVRAEDVAPDGVEQRWRKFFSLRVMKEISGANILRWQRLRSIETDHRHRIFPEKDIVSLPKARAGPFASKHRERNFCPYLHSVSVDPGGIQIICHCLPIRRGTWRTRPNPQEAACPASLSRRRRASPNLYAEDALCITRR